MTNPNDGPPAEQPSVAFRKDIQAQTPPANEQPTQPVVASTDPQRRFAELLRPPVLPGESREDLAVISLAIVAQMQPRDAIEQIAAAEVIRATWNRLRLARLHAAHLSASGWEFFNRTFGFPKGDYCVRWTRDEPSDRVFFEELLAKHGLTRDMLLASGLAQQIDAFELLSRMDFANSNRLDATLREFHRRRAMLAAEAVQSTPQSSLAPRSPNAEKPAADTANSDKADR